MAIQDEVKRLREEMGWSQRKLALKAGVSNATISRIENGVLHPDPETLEKLAQALPTSYEHLMRVAGYIQEPDKNTLYNVLEAYGFGKRDLKIIGEMLNRMNPEVPLLGAMNWRPSLEHQMR